MVCYDISDPKRLRKTHKVVSGFGDALQYSVFLCAITPAEKIELEMELHEIIHHKEDSVLIVRLGTAERDIPQEFQWIGRSCKTPPRRSVIF